MVHNECFDAAMGPRALTSTSEVVEWSKYQLQEQHTDRAKLILLCGFLCSKTDVQGVLRKLIAMHVLKEETWRQDNQYGNVMACLKVNKRKADSLLASKQPIIMPHLMTGSKPSGSSSATAAPVPAKKGRQADALKCSCACQER